MECMQLIDQNPSASVDPFVPGWPGVERLEAVEEAVVLETPPTEERVEGVHRLFVAGRHRVAGVDVGRALLQDGGLVLRQLDELLAQLVGVPHVREEGGDGQEHVVTGGGGCSDWGVSRGVGCLRCVVCRVNCTVFRVQCAVYSVQSSVSIEYVWCAMQYWLREENSTNATWHRGPASLTGA